MSEILKLKFFSTKTYRVRIVFWNLKTWRRNRLVIVKQRVTVNTVPKLSTHRPVTPRDLVRSEVFFSVFIVYFLSCLTFKVKSFSFTRVKPLRKERLWTQYWELWRSRNKVVVGWNLCLEKFNFWTFLTISFVFWFFSFLFLFFLFSDNSIFF